MTLEQFKTFELPDLPGIYFFKKGKEILYVGKATSLRDRVRSYFSRDLMDTRGPLIVKMVEDADTLEWKTTNSVLEALILEAHTIKTYLPPANIKEKDNKSYNYVIITDEEFPRVLIERGRNITHGLPDRIPSRFIAGPFPHGQQLREAMKIVRKLFPFRDKCIPKLETKNRKLDASRRGVLTACFNRQIGLCPGVCTGEVTAKQYHKTIKNIELFFSGKVDTVKKNLEKEMKGYAKTREFEKAESVKRTLYALDHIRDIGLIKSDLVFDPLLHAEETFRIEAYDIAHISGTSTVGVMVVMEGGELNTQEYRKFKIHGVDGKVTVDDTKNLTEVLTRRFGHAEWTLPNLIVIDGGIAQRNVAEKVLKERGFNIEIVSVVKDERHKAREIVGKKSTIIKHEKEILLLNGEAHRFAITYHRNVRSKNAFR